MIFVLQGVKYCALPPSPLLLCSHLEHNTNGTLIVNGEFAFISVIAGWACLKKRRRFRGSPTERQQLASCSQQLAHLSTNMFALCVRARR